MRQVRALFNEKTIRVYQAYGHEIADKALQSQTFISPFKLDRMTWIKPSYLWMMYRSGWGMKSGQERILAIEISRIGFEWALANSCLTHYDPLVYSSLEEWSQMKAISPVRIQFDPDRTVNMEPLSQRAIQIGLSGEAVQHYVKKWITKITDITNFSKNLHKLILSGNTDAYFSMVPREEIYPLDWNISKRLGITT
jgi:hypothetical protein